MGQRGDVGVLSSDEIFALYIEPRDVFRAICFAINCGLMQFEVIESNGAEYTSLDCVPQTCNGIVHVVVVVVIWRGNIEVHVHLDCAGVLIAH